MLLKLPNSGAELRPFAILAKDSQSGLQSDTCEFSRTQCPVFYLATLSSVPKDPYVIHTPAQNTKHSII